MELDFHVLAHGLLRSITGPDRTSLGHESRHPFAKISAAVTAANQVLIVRQALRQQAPQAIFNVKQHTF